MHFTLLILAHIFIFWVIPITGNYKLYGSARCNKDEEVYYGCKNFHQN